MLFLLAFDLTICAISSQEVLVILEERLGELEQEKQEFAEYEQLERQRRALEFSSYNHEFQKVRSTVTDLCPSVLKFVQHSNSHASEYGADSG